MTATSGIQATKTEIGVVCRDIAEMQSQLQRKKAPRKGASRDDAAKFFSWRKKCVTALDFKQRRLAALKSELRLYYQAQAESALTDPLRRLFRITRRLISSGATPTAEEQEVLDSIQLGLRS